MVAKQLSVLAYESKSDMMKKFQSCQVVFVIKAFNVVLLNNWHAILPTPFVSN